MNIKIVSDGTPENTIVYNVETGERLEGVTHIDWHLEVNDLAQCNIRLHNIPLEVEAGNIKSYNLRTEDEDSSSREKQGWIRRSLQRIF